MDQIENDPISPLWSKFTLIGPHWSLHGLNQNNPGAAIIILCLKIAISTEPNLRWTSDSEQSVNSSLSVVVQQKNTKRSICLCLWRFDEVWGRIFPNHRPLLENCNCIRLTSDQSVNLSLSIVVQFESSFFTIAKLRFLMIIDNFWKNSGIFKNNSGDEFKR